MSAAKTLMSASAAILVAATTPALAGPILDDIKANDSLICLVSPTAPGFSVPDSTGIFQGFNADFCRMAAAAVLGDASKADIRGVGFSDSMKTIVAGEAHMGSRSITRTGTRDADEGHGLCRDDLLRRSRLHGAPCAWCYQRNRTRWCQRLRRGRLDHASEHCRLVRRARDDLPCRKYRRQDCPP